MSLMHALSQLKAADKSKLKPQKDMAPQAASYPFSATDPKVEWAAAMKALDAASKAGEALGVQQDVMRRAMPTLEGVMAKYDAMVAGKGVPAGLRDKVKYTAQRRLLWEYRNGVNLDDPTLEDRVLNYAVKFHKVSAQKGRKAALATMGLADKGTAERYIAKRSAEPDPIQEFFAEKVDANRPAALIADVRSGRKTFVEAFKSWLDSFPYKYAEHTFGRPEPITGPVGYVADFTLSGLKKIVGEPVVDALAATLDSTLPKEWRQPGMRVERLAEEMIPWFALAGLGGAPAAVAGVVDLVGRPKEYVQALAESPSMLFGKDRTLEERVSGAIIIGSAAAMARAGIKFFQRFKKSKKLKDLETKALEYLEKKALPVGGEHTLPEGNRPLLPFEERTPLPPGARPTLPPSERTALPPGERPAGPSLPQREIRELPARETAKPPVLPHEAKPALPEPRPLSLPGEERPALPPRRPKEPTPPKSPSKMGDTELRRAIDAKRKAVKKALADMGRATDEEAAQKAERRFYEAYDDFKAHAAERDARKPVAASMGPEELVKAERNLRMRLFQLNRRVPQNATPEAIGAWAEDFSKLQKQHKDVAAALAAKGIEAPPTPKPELDPVSRLKLRNFKQKWKAYSDEKRAQLKAQKDAERAQRAAERAAAAEEARLRRQTAQEEAAARKAAEAAEKEKLRQARLEEAEARRRAAIEEKERLRQAREKEAAARKAAAEAEKERIRLAREAEAKERARERVARQLREAEEAERKRRLRQVEEDIRRLEETRAKAEAYLRAKEKAKSGSPVDMEAVSKSTGEAAEFVRGMRDAVKKGAETAERLKGASGPEAEALKVDLEHAVSRIKDNAAAASKRLNEPKTGGRPDDLIPPPRPKRPEIGDMRVIGGKRVRMNERETAAARRAVDVYEETLAQYEKIADPEKRVAAMREAGRSLRDQLDRIATKRVPKLRGESDIEAGAARANATVIPLRNGDAGVIMPDGTLVRVTRGRIGNIDAESFKREHGRPPRKGEEAAGAAWSVTVDTPKGPIPVRHFIALHPDAPAGTMAHELMHIAENIGYGKKEWWQAARRYFGGDAKMIKAFREGTGPFSVPGTIFAKVRELLADIRALLFNKDEWMARRLGKAIRVGRSHEVAAHQVRYAAFPPSDVSKAPPDWMPRTTAEKDYRLVLNGNKLYFVRLTNDLPNIGVECSLLTQKTAVLAAHGGMSWMSSDMFGSMMSMLRAMGAENVIVSQDIRHVGTQEAKALRAWLDADPYAKKIGAESYDITAHQPWHDGLSKLPAPLAEYEAPMVAGGKGEIVSMDDRTYAVAVRSPGRNMYSSFGDAAAVDYKVVGGDLIITSLTLDSYTAPNIRVLAGAIDDTMRHAGKHSVAITGAALRGNRRVILHMLSRELRARGWTVEFSGESVLAKSGGGGDMKVYGGRLQSMVASADMPVLPQPAGTLTEGGKYPRHLPSPQDRLEQIRRKLPFLAEHEHSQVTPGWLHLSYDNALSPFLFDMDDLIKAHGVASAHYLADLAVFAMRVRHFDNAKAWRLLQIEDVVESESLIDAVKNHYAPDGHVVAFHATRDGKGFDSIRLTALGDIGFHAGPFNAAAMRADGAVAPLVIRGPFLQISHDSGLWPDALHRICRELDPVLTKQEFSAAGYPKSIRIPKIIAAVKAVLNKHGYRGIIYTNEFEGFPGALAEIRDADTLITGGIPSNTTRIDNTMLQLGVPTLNRVTGPAASVMRYVGKTVAKAMPALQRMRGPVQSVMIFDPADAKLLLTSEGFDPKQYSMRYAAFDEDAVAAKRATYWAKVKEFVRGDDESPFSGEFESGSNKEAIPGSFHTSWKDIENRANVVWNGIKQRAGFDKSALRAREPKASAIGAAHRLADEVLSMLDRAVVGDTPLNEAEIVAVKYAYDTIEQFIRRWGKHGKLKGEIGELSKKQAKILAGHVAERSRAGRRLAMYRRDAPWNSQLVYEAERIAARLIAGKGDGLTASEATAILKHRRNIEHAVRVLRDRHQRLANMFASKKKVERVMKLAEHKHHEPWSEPYLQSAMRVAWDMMNANKRLRYSADGRPMAKGDIQVGVESAAKVIREYAARYGTTIDDAAEAFARDAQDNGYTLDPDMMSVARRLASNDGYWEAKYEAFGELPKQPAPTSEFPELTSDLWFRRAREVKAATHEDLTAYANDLRNMLRDLGGHLPDEVWQALYMKISKFVDVYEGQPINRATAEFQAIRKQIRKAYGTWLIETAEVGTRYDNPDLVPPVRRMKYSSDYLRKWLEETERRNLLADMGPVAKAWWKATGGMMTLMRELMGSGDFSFTATQAYFWLAHNVFTNPVGVAKMFEAMFKSTFSKKWYDAHLERIMTRVYGDTGEFIYDDAYAAGLRLSEPHKPKGPSAELFETSMPDETLPGKIANMPIVKQWRDAAARGFSAAGNEIRFNQMIYPRLEKNPELRKVEKLPILREYVKNAYMVTGKSPVGLTPQVSTALNAALFAARLELSRWQNNLLLGVWGDKVFGRTSAKMHEGSLSRGGLFEDGKLADTPRAEALRLQGTGLAIAAGTIALVKLLGGEVSMDPDDANFMRVRLPGTKTYVSLAPPGSAHVWKTLFTLGERGAETAGLKKRDRKFNMMRFQQYIGQAGTGKLSPGASMAYNLAMSKAQPRATRESPGDIVMNHLTPMTLGAMIEALKEHERYDPQTRALVALAVLAMESIGVRTGKWARGRASGAAKPKKELTPAERRVERMVK